MVLSSWSSLFSVLALRSRMIRPEAVKNLTGMPRLQARVPMAMARRGPARMPASSVEHEVLGSVDELEGRELFASPVGGERGHAPVVPVKFFGLGEAGLSEQPVPFGFGAAGVLGPEQGREEAELAGGGVLDGPSEHASGQWQVAGEFHDLFGGGLPCRAVRSLRGISRHLFPPCRCCIGSDRGRVRCPRRPA